MLPIPIVRPSISRATCRSSGKVALTLYYGREFCQHRTFNRSCRHITPTSTPCHMSHIKSLGYNTDRFDCGRSNFSLSVACSIVVLNSLHYYFCLFPTQWVFSGSFVRVALLLFVAIIHVHRYPLYWPRTVLRVLLSVAPAAHALRSAVLRHPRLSLPRPL